MNTKLVVGMGEVLWDMLPEGKQLGGAPANFAYHMSRFGFESYVVSAVGDDNLGREILEEFNSRNLASLIETLPYPTGTVEVSLDARGVPRYEIHKGVAWDNIPFTPKLEQLAARTKVVCFGSLAQRSSVSANTISRFLNAMPDGEGQLKIFDINLRQNFYTKELIDSSMQKCNILKINDGELELLAEMFSLRGNEKEICSELLSRYELKLLILTCGEKGSYVFSAEGESFLETPKVEVEDTVGAGDSFTAAFVAALVSGLEIRQAHELAVKTSAFVCTQKGAMPEHPEALSLQKK